MITVRKFTHGFTLADWSPWRHRRALSRTAFVRLWTPVKTTLLNAVAQTNPPEDCIVLIEKTSEILN